MKGETAMPHSSYSRIYDLIFELSKKNESIRIFEFSEEINSKQIESFAIWRAGPTPNSPIKSYCSPSSIRRLIRFASELGFLRIGDQSLCEITPIGRNALNTENYPVQLAAQLIKYLRDEAGITLEEIENIIVDIPKPSLPYFDTIYHQILSTKDLRISENRLRGVLFLLERCKVLETATRKAYFPREI